MTVISITRRALLKQAKHVLGPGAVLTVDRENSVYWRASAHSALHVVATSGMGKRAAMVKLNWMLVALDVGGWSWRRT